MIYEYESLFVEPTNESPPTSSDRGAKVPDPYAPFILTCYKYASIEVLVEEDLHKIIFMTSRR